MTPSLFLFFDEGEPTPKQKAWNLPGHVLVVREYNDDGDYFEVEHPEGCPQEKIDILSDASEEPVASYYLAYECLVGEIVHNVGFRDYFVHADDPSPDLRWRSPEKVGVGRHEIEAWEEHYSGVPGHSEPEWDSGLALKS